MLDSQQLRDSFEHYRAAAEKFSMRLVEQLDELVSSHSLTLAVPLQARVKSLESLSEKVDRKHLQVNSVIEVPDFVGVRAILLFLRDATVLGEAIAKHFGILDVEDTSTRLKESEFGYVSRHYHVRVPREWLAVPSFSGYADFQAEIQVRTAAQHIWAATSHILQYKQEKSVPTVLRRSIYRVSALLETVDLEFERLLDERREYVEQVSESSPDQPLDVDALAKVLDRLLPASNKRDDEPYGELLDELLANGLQTTADVTAFIESRLDHALELERKVAAALLGVRPDPAGRVTAKIGGVIYMGEPERVKRGVFYSHVGLVRLMLQSGAREAPRPPVRKAK